MADEEIKDDVSTPENEDVAVVEAQADDNAEDDSGIPPEEGIEQLKRSLEEQKKQIEEQKRLRIEAEKVAYQAQLHAQQSAQEAKNAYYHQIVGSISQFQEREQTLMAQWAEAKSMGDYQKEAEIQKEMVLNANALQKLQSGKTHLENELRAPVTPVNPPQQSGVDEFIAGQPPRNRDWLSRHRETLQLEDPARAQLVKAAHFKALGQGFVEQSDGYYHSMEEELGLIKQSRRVVEEDEDDGVMSSASQSTARRSVSPPAAPVSRGGARKGTVRLSPEEREIARMTGQSDEEYYRNKTRGERNRA